MDYPFFMQQPWPFVLSIFGLIGAFMGLCSSLLAWERVRRLNRILAAMGAAMTQLVLELERYKHGDDEPPPPEERLH